MAQSDLTRVVEPACKALAEQQNVELVDINNMRKEPKKLSFVKMRGTGNDYLYFDCFEQTVESPESVAVRLSNRRTGVGADGVVLILPSKRADAKMRMFNAAGVRYYSYQPTGRMIRIDL